MPAGIGLKSLRTDVAPGQTWVPRISRAAWLASLVLVSTTLGCWQAEQKMEERPVQVTREEPKRLSHEQTLAWINDHQAWRRARKTKPIWARAVDPDEIGKEFQTADQAIEVAREGYWLCVGVAGEPWFQKLSKIEDKYDRFAAEAKQFSFDNQAHAYAIFRPKADVGNWAAQVQGEGIKGFSIRPNYDLEHPLVAPAGGYVVKGDVPDPYHDKPNDVWLVQQSLFEDTYEFLPDDKEHAGQAADESHGPGT